MKSQSCPWKSKFLPPFLARKLGAFFCAGVLSVASHSLHAATNTWSGSTNGTWDTTTSNWSGSAFTSGNDALFTGTPTNNVTAASGLTIGAITLDNTFTGMVTMTGANTVNGATTISSGTLKLTNLSGLGSSAVTLNSNGLLWLSPSGNATFSNAVSGSGILKASPYTDTTTLSGNLSGFTGVIDVFDGGNNGSQKWEKIAFGTTQGNLPSSSATIKVESGATLYLNNALNYAASVQLAGTGNPEALGALRIESSANQTGTVTLSGNATIGSNSGTGAVSGNIGESGGSFGITKVAAGTVVLSGSNTYSGGTTVSTGTLTVGSSYALGSGGVTLTGGAMTFSTGLTLPNNITISNAPTFTAGSGTLALNGNITGSPNGNWTLVPTNKITLGGSNSLTMAANFAGVNVNAGAGGVDITGTTTINGNSSNQQSGYVNLAGTVTLTVQPGGSFAFNGTTNTTPTSIIGQNAAGTSTLLVNGGLLTVGANTGLALGNNIGTAIGVLTVSSGTATITAGSATATDARSYVMLGKDSSVGVINLNGGVLATGRNFVRDGAGTADTSGTATFNFGGGTLKALASQTDWINSSTRNTNQLAFTSVTTTGTSTIDSNGFSVAINNNITGSGGFIITDSAGTGSVTLGGSSTYTGATSVNAGTLTVNGTGSINGSSGIIISGSGAKLVQTSTVASTPAITLTKGTLDGTGTVGAVTVGAGTGGIVSNGNGSSTTALTLGALTFSGAGTASLRVPGGATTNSPALAVTGALTLSGGANSVTVNLTPTVALASGSTYWLISYGGAFTGNASTDFTLSPGILSGRQAGVFASTAASNGYITMTVAGDNPVWSGAANGVLVQYATNTATTTGNLALKTNHTATDFWTNDALEFNDTYNLGSGDVAVTQTTVNINGGGTNAGGIAANTITFNNSAVNYSITSSDGTGITAGSVTKNGAGSVSINNANTYSGGTVLNAGNLNLNNASAIGTGALTIVSGTIDNTSGSPITLSTNNTQSWNGDFAFAGSNDLNLGTGAVTLGASRTVTASGTGVLSVGGVISGSGFGLTKSGSGTLALNGANTFTGGVTINGGTVRAGNSAALGTSSNTLSFGAASNGKLQVNGNSITVGGLSGDSTATIENSSATSGTFTVNSASTNTFGGTLQDGNAGTLAVVKSGAGTLNLTGASSYSGGTTVNSGTMGVGGNSALGTGIVTLAANTTLNTVSAATLANNITVNSGVSINSTGGTLALNGAITGTPTGNVFLNPTNKITLGGQGNLTVAGDFAGLWVNAGSVDITGTTTINGASGNVQSGYFNLVGASTLTVQPGGSFAFNGTTNANYPTSIVGQNAAGTSTLLVNGGSLNIGANTAFALGNNLTSAIGVLTISSGTATIAAGSTTATDGRSYIMLGKDSATGTINLNGGVLATGRNFVRDGSGTADTSGAANFVFGGGTLRALASQTDWLNSSTKNTNQLAMTSVSTTATSTIDSNGFNVAINSAISGTGGFNITDTAGTGSITFGGVSSYTGATSINSGKLIVSGSLSATTALSVASGATLQVDGLVNSAATATIVGKVQGIGSLGAVRLGDGGTIAAGNGASGTLSVSGLAMAGSNTGGAHVSLQISGTTLGTQYNVISSSGAVTLGNNLATLDITTSYTPSFVTGDLLSSDRIYLSIGGYTSGTFSNAIAWADSNYGGMTLNEITDNNGHVWAVIYGADHTNPATLSGGADIALIAVPEPSSWVMLLGGVGMLSFLQRIRSKRVC